MREPLISRNPIFYPGVCVACGVQSNRRWYVDIGVELDYHFNPMNEGNILFCNECWNALVKSVNRGVKTFVESNKGTLKVNTPEKENDGTTGSNPTPIGDDSEPERNDQVSEPSVSESKSDDSELSSFRAHFALK